MAYSRTASLLLLGILIPVLAVAASLPDKATGDSLNVTLVGAAETPGGAMGVAVNGSYAYVVDEYGNFQVFNVGDPTAPVAVDTLGTPGSATAITLSGNLAYVADFDQGIRIIDVSNPAAPTEVGFFQTSGYAYDVAVSGSVAYVADAIDGLRIVDVSAPTAPYELGFFLTTGWATSVDVSGHYAYLADGDGGLRIIDVSNPAQPSEAGVFNQDSYMTTVTVDGSLAYVIDDWNGLLTLDVSNPAAPVQVGNCNPSAPVNEITIDCNFAYLAADTYGVGAGFQVLDISDPTALVHLGYYYTGDHGYGVAVANGLAYVADNHDGLLILRYDPPTPTMVATMTPVNPPVVIDPAGGDFLYDVSIQNFTDQPIVADVLLDALLPNGNPYPVLTKFQVTFPAGSTIVRNALSQHVPAGAPAGTYAYRIWVKDTNQTVIASDEFPFEKLGPVLGATGDAIWTLDGWDDQTETGAVPDQFALTGAYPNPFNPTTTLRFALAQPAMVDLRVYDLKGQLIKTLISGREMPAGSFSEVWRGDDDRGLTVGAGVYLYRLQAGDFSATGRMTMIK